MAHKNKYYGARTSRQLLRRFCTQQPLATKGKRRCELQLAVMVLPCWDVMEEPLRAAWRKGRQWWAPSLDPLTPITPPGAPQHPPPRLAPLPSSLRDAKKKPKSHSLYRSDSPSPHMVPLCPPKTKPQPRRVTSWSLISDSKAYLEPICNALTPKIALPCDA